MKRRRPDKISKDSFQSTRRTSLLTLARCWRRCDRGSRELSSWSYDDYNALAVGFGPTERASEAIFSIAVFPRWVSLFFFQGAKLEDPEKILEGRGKTIRHIVLEGQATLDRPAVKALMKQALERAPKSLDEKTRGRLIIKSISAKQRPRRPA